MNRDFDRKLRMRTASSFICLSPAPDDNSPLESVFINLTWFNLYLKGMKLIDEYRK